MPMERNALLAIRGRCGAVCPIGHKGALRCNMYYWPLWGAAVQYILPPLEGAVEHCVLLATMGRYGTLCPIGHYGAL